ncbi:MAG TPA: hypothetical protein VHV47_00770 [Opitutaceae bacterium]|nr:hypothetical protein [Opitutaceae bacterium]
MPSMPLPDQTPKLPKLPFLVADAALLAAAWMISDQARHPLSSESLLAVVACVGGAGVLGAIPFLTDYARKQDEALDERQRGLEALSRTVATSAEQISIAARGIQEIAELAQKNLSAAEALTRKGASSPGPSPREGRNEKAEARGEKTAERLEAAADKIAQAAADLARTEAGLQKRIASAGRERERSRPAPEPAPSEPAAAPEPPAVPESPPAPPAAEPSAVETEVRAAQAEAAAESAPVEAPAAEVPAAPEPEPAAEAPPAEPPPRKPRPEPAPEPPAEPVQEELAPEFSQLAPEEAAPVAAVSADGATRLLVTAYIGIGNRLFIRGEGPGLSWDAGVPLQFVSIGKWRWESAEASGPVSFKLYKNDQVECSSLGEQSIEPGQQLEVAAAF